MLQVKFISVTYNSGVPAHALPGSREARYGVQGERSDALERIQFSKVLGLRLLLIIEELPAAEQQRPERFASQTLNILGPMGTSEPAKAGRRRCVGPSATAFPDWLSRRLISSFLRTGGTRTVNDHMQPGAACVVRFSD